MAAQILHHISIRYKLYREPDGLNRNQCEKAGPKQTGKQRTKPNSSRGYHRRGLNGEKFSQEASQCRYPVQKTEGEYSPTHCVQLPEKNQRFGKTSRRDFIRI